MKAAIVGITGYTGVELMRLIEQHPYLEIGTLHRSGNKDSDLTEEFPHFLPLNAKIQAFDAKNIMAHNDLVFFATPSGVSKDLVEPFIENSFPVIDLSGDLRLKNGESYRKWYNKEPANPDILMQANYSLPEFQTNKSMLIANPGCYATATNLLLAPLVKAQIIQTDSIIVDAKSGLSGAGKGLSQSSHFVNVYNNMSMYKVNQHQHIPEIIQFLQQFDNQLKSIQFTTSLIPVSRGIFVSAYVKLKEKVVLEHIKTAYNSCYADKYFVRINHHQKLPDLHQVIGSNFCDIGYIYNECTGILTLVAVIDNLIKGASGQAIQNFNIWAGLDEACGLKQLPNFI